MKEMDLFKNIEIRYVGEEPQENVKPVLGQNLRDITPPEGERTVTRDASQVQPRDREMKPCCWVNSKGRNIGKECGKMAYDGRQYCAAHNTVDMINKRKQGLEIKEPESKPIEDEYEEEDYEEVRAPTPTPIFLPQQAIRPANNDRDRILGLMEGIMLILTKLEIS